jgi:hypothetical protein
MPMGFARVNAPFLPPSCVSSHYFDSCSDGGAALRGSVGREMGGGAPAWRQRKEWGSCSVRPIFGSPRCSDREWVRCMDDRLEGYIAATVSICDPFW